MTTDPTPSATEPRPPIDGAVHIPLHLLAPSPTNPRKRFNPARVEEIADSMRKVGQIQPIRVRPKPGATGKDGQPIYEIVVGETRWRSAKLAELASLECIVRDMTDFEVLEVQLIENLQRDDLHPLEEAEGYEQLLRKPDGLQGYATVEELAARLGKSPGYVYARLKLCALCPAGREAFFAGTINASVALLIARMPEPAEQAEATVRIVSGFGGEPYSFRSAAEYLQREFMLRLDKARFDTQATYKVEGPCSACPKRSGAAPDLFADVTSGDMCQDSRCYHAKAEEAHQAELQAARDAGHTVLAGAEARRVLPVPILAPIAGYYKLAQPCPELSASKRPLIEQLGPKFKDGIVVLDHPSTDLPVYLAKEGPLKKALKARGLLRPPPAAAPALATKGSGEKARGSGNGTNGAQAAAEAAPVKVKGSPAEQMREAQARRGELFGQRLFGALRAAIGKTEQWPTSALRAAVQQVFDNATTWEGSRLVCAARGWSDIDHPNAQELTFSGKLAKASARELCHLLIELTICEECSDEVPLELMSSDSVALELAAELGVDVAAIDSQAAQEVARRMNDELAAAPAASKPATARKAAKPPKDATAEFLAQHGGAAA